MESCYGGLSTRLKQRAVTEFLSAENVTPSEIHRRLQAVYGENTVNRTTVNRSRPYRNGEGSCPNASREGMWGSGNITPLILNVGTRWRSVATFTPRSLYPRGIILSAH